MDVLKFRRIISLTKVYAVVIKFLHIFVNELVFTFFFLKYQNHFDMKKSPFKNSGNSWGGGGVIKDPLRTENPGGWGGANQRVFCWRGIDIFWNHTIQN